MQILKTTPRMTDLAESVNLRMGDVGYFLETCNPEVTKEVLSAITELQELHGLLVENTETYELVNPQPTNRE